jgi:hypothetical protein
MRSNCERRVFCSAPARARRRSSARTAGSVSCGRSIRGRRACDRNTATPRGRRDRPRGTR